ADQHARHRFATESVAGRPHADLHVDSPGWLWGAGPVDDDARARPMTTACCILVSFTPLALLAACGTTPELVVSALQAERFGNSEWSEPVNLGAPINSSVNDMNASLSPDELSLYFGSGRAGGLGGVD